MRIALVGAVALVLLAAAPARAQTSGPDDPDALAECGDGVVDEGEECDDGDLEPGGCCDGTCRLEPAGTVCRTAADACDAAETCDGVGDGCPDDAPAADDTACDDEDACTTGERCVAGFCEDGSQVVCPACETCEADTGCVAAPRDACREVVAPGRARLRVKSHASGRGGMLAWSWVGEETSGDALGDPLATDGFTLCVYDESGDVPVVLHRATAPPGGRCGRAPCWTVTTKDGEPAAALYTAGPRTAGGLRSLAIRTGDDGRARIVASVRGHGASAFPTPPFALPLRVQLEGNHDECWEAVHSATGVVRNGPGAFVGRSD